MNTFKQTHKNHLMNIIDSLEGMNNQWRISRMDEEIFISMLEDEFGSLNTKEEAIIKGVLNECRNITYKNMPKIIANTLIEFITNSQQ